MVHICPLQANIVKYGSEPRIGWGINHFVGCLGAVDKFIGKTYAIVFERGSRYHVETTCEIFFILQRAAKLPPIRSIAVLAWPKEKQLLSFCLAHSSHRNVLRKNHLYSFVAVGTTWKDNAKRGIAVFVRHNQPHPAGILDGRRSLRAAWEAKKKLAKRPTNRRFLIAVCSEISRNCTCIRIRESMIAANR